MSSESEFQFEKESDLSVNEIKVMYDDFVNPGLSKLYQFSAISKLYFPQ